MFILVGKTALVDSEHGKCSDIIVPRNDLIEKIAKIENLETRLNQQLSEHSFEMNHARKKHSIELQTTCEKYEKIINDLKDERKNLEINYHEERNQIQSAVEDRNAEHAIAKIQLEAKLNEKILAESDKVADLKVVLENTKAEYEQLLLKAAECLKETTDTLEGVFKDQINDREGQITKLLNEIQTKKEEFFHYCNQLNLDNDRKVAQLKLHYETRLKESNENILQWRTDACILTKKIESTSTTCDQLRTDIALVLDEHSRNKKYIGQLEQNICELQRDLDTRTKLVEDKELCLIELIEKRSTVEKMKQFLNDRAIQLEAQINPLQEEIKESTCKIHQMEDLKKKLFWKIDELYNEILLLRNRCQAVTNDLKTEKVKNHHAHTVIERMCSDISIMVQHIQNPSKLKELSVAMFKTYVIICLLIF